MSKDYRDTLNLPQTDLSMKAGLSKKEPELLEYWNAIDLYRCSSLSIGSIAFTYFCR